MALVSSMTSSLRRLPSSATASRILSRSRDAAFSTTVTSTVSDPTPTTTTTTTTAAAPPITITHTTSSQSPSPPSSVTTNESATNRESAEESTEKRRLRALSLYRQLLRGAEHMPTPNRQNYIKRKTTSEYRKHATLTDGDEIEFQLRLADTNLDTVLVQAEHLSRLFSDPDYQNHN
mmetsp:Transcript_1064/g.2300  ORF Transcript_1064/g.2300 Transcript_1064/m.2300 type:complete len:177 (+) Transcript_1064:39-569(+)